MVAIIYLQPYKIVYFNGGVVSIPAYQGFTRGLPLVSLYLEEKAARKRARKRAKEKAEHEAAGAQKPQENDEQETDADREIKQDEPSPKKPRKREKGEGGESRAEEKARPRTPA